MVGADRGHALAEMLCKYGRAGVALEGCAADLTSWCCGWHIQPLPQSLAQTVVISGPGTSSITTSNSRSTIVSSGGSTTAVAFERVACSVGADQLVLQLK